MTGVGGFAMLVSKGERTACKGLEKCSFHRDCEFRVSTGEGSRCDEDSIDCLFERDEGLSKLMWSTHDLGHQVLA